MTAPLDTPLPCPFCSRRMPRRSAMCRLCKRSYDETAHREGTVIEAMLWAANRVRRFEALAKWNRRAPVRDVTP